MLAYLRLMLQNRIASMRPRNLQREGRGKLKVGMSYLGYGLLALFLYGMVIFLEMMLFEAGISIGEPRAIIAIAFLLCTAVTLIYGFFNVVGLLFFNKDNGFIAALPVSSRGVLTAKLATVLVGEIGLTLAIGVPLIIRYGIHMELGVAYYLRALLCMAFVPMVPIAVAVLISFLLIRVSALWKRRESMTIVMTFLLMAGLIGVQMNLGMNISDEQMGSMMTSMLFGRFSLTEMVLGAYPPLRWLTDAITGGGFAAWGWALMFAGISVAALGLMIWLFGGGYLRLALRQEETLRRANAGAKRSRGKDRVRKPFWALYRQEMREVITVPVYATNCLTGSVMFPVIIVVMLMSMQNNFGEGLTLVQAFLPLLPHELYLSIAAGVLCFTTTMGLAVATAVSREGKQHDFRRVMPVSGSTQLMAKLLMGMTYNCVTTVFTAVALWVLLPPFWAETLLALLISQLFSLMWCTAGLLLDVYHARLKWKTETEAVKQSMNSLFSMLIGFAMVALLVGAYLLCMELGLSMNQALAVIVLLMALADFALVKWLRSKGSMTYCLREYAN